MPIRPALIEGSSPGAASARAEVPCDVQLSLTALADQVVLVRQVIGSLAESLGFRDRIIQDMRLAVTEACTNVVRHAYDGDPGRLEVAASAASDRLTVTVADHGRGLRPRIDGGAGGLGLPLMAALAASVEFDDTEGHGTTVRLSFLRAE